MVAVLRELKHRDKHAEIRFWCDRKFAPQARGIMHHFDPDLPVQTVISGKLRRYHTLPLWRQLLRPVTIVIPNLIDMVKVGVGFVQSLFKLWRWRPDVVFTKGGFVCLPVGLAAKVLRIPLVIHDSDALPGLTNKILAKWATAIATGAPLKFYPYPEKISRYVGIPIAREYRPINESIRASRKEKLGFNPTQPLIVVTGGGLGAKIINDAVAQCLDQLLEVTSVALISGTVHYDELRLITPQDDPRFQLHDFVDRDMPDLLSAADVVVARAGATTILELAALARPTILIPNRYLTGGHQLKNAAVYAERGAVELLDELEIKAHPQLLADALAALLVNPKQRQKMGEIFHTFSKPHAAEDMADMVEAAATKRL